MLILNEIDASIKKLLIRNHIFPQKSRKRTYLRQNFADDLHI